MPLEASHNVRRVLENTQISPSPCMTQHPHGASGWQMQPDTAQERCHRLFFRLFRGLFLLQDINFIFYFQCISIYSFREFHKNNFILEKEFQFHYCLFTDDEETGSIPSPVKLLPRNRHRSREVVGPASQPDADPPPRKQSFGIRQRNFLIRGCFSASRVLIAFSSQKERVCKDKTVSSWSTS